MPLNDSKLLFLKNIKRMEMKYQNNRYFKKQQKVLKTQSLAVRCAYALIHKQGHICRIVFVKAFFTFELAPHDYTALCTRSCKRQVQVQCTIFM